MNREIEQSCKRSNIDLKDQQKSVIISRKSILNDDKLIVKMEKISNKEKIPLRVENLNSNKNKLTLHLNKILFNLNSNNSLKIKNCTKSKKTRLLR